MPNALDVPLRPFGRIARLQLQPESLTRGEKPNRIYDPSSLLSLPDLTLTPRGALARLPEGGTLLDAHHIDHPATRGSPGENELSLGFTGHYDLMRREYGDRLWDGCAGENILVEAPGRVFLEQLLGGVAIRSSAAGELAWLDVRQVAAPCRPFSGYVLGGSEASVKDALQFLHGGMRGFYCSLQSPGPVVISVGDEVLLPER